MNYRRSLALLWVCRAVGFILCFFCAPLGFAVVAAGAIQTVVFYRCPKCKAPIRGCLPSYCSRCGASLFDPPSDGPDAT